VNTYLITYDLNRPGQNYNELYDAIKKVAVGSSWWHCLDSNWIINSNADSVTVRNSLTPHIDANDSLLVARLSGGAAWTGFNTECSDWLRNNL
jgi:hypothetical protein